jgi:hypothetical protein
MPSLSSLLAGLSKDRRSATDSKAADHDQSESSADHFGASGVKQSRRRSWLLRRGGMTAWGLFRPGGTGKRGSRAPEPKPESSEETLRGPDAPSTGDGGLADFSNGRSQSTVTAILVSCRIRIFIFSLYFLYCVNLFLPPNLPTRVALASVSRDSRPWHSWPLAEPMLTPNHQSPMSLLTGQ